MAATGTFLWAAAVAGGDDRYLLGRLFGPDKTSTAATTCQRTENPFRVCTGNSRDRSDACYAHTF